jgi:acyl carrier protein
MDSKIISIIAKTLEVEPSAIEPDLGIGDLPEWTSLKHMMIIAEIEKAFNIKFNSASLMDLEDVSDLVSLVEKTVTNA